MPIRIIASSGEGVRILGIVSSRVASTNSRELRKKFLRASLV